MRTLTNTELVKYVCAADDVVFARTRSIVNAARVRQLRARWRVLPSTGFDVGSVDRRIAAELALQLRPHRTLNRRCKTVQGAGIRRCNVECSDVQLS